MKTFPAVVLFVFISMACSSRPDAPGKEPKDFESMCWRKVVTDDAPLARLDHAMATDRSRARIYLWGGRNGNQFYDDFWVFEPDKAEWRRIETDDRPPARSGHSLVFDEESRRLILFGGMRFTASGDLKIFRDLWIHSEENGWSREFFSAGPVGRAWHAAQAVEGSMLAFGGYAGPPQYHLQDVWSLDLKELTFRRIATDGGPLMAGKAVLLEMGGSSSLLAFAPSKLLVFGRHGVPEPTQTGLWELQVEMDQWSLVDTRNTPDQDFSCGFADPGSASILVARGPEEDDPDREWTLWALTGESDRWWNFEAEGGPAGSHGMGCTPNPGRVGGWVCFGGAQGKLVGEDTWLLSASGEEEAAQ